ncbi:MAG: NADPH:quinone reductase [Actinomycetota bacterium]|nr:NADPH:quinone reductase [Actinomycetota bacterium]
MATRAVVIEEFGGPDVLNRVEVGKPPPASGRAPGPVIASGQEPGVEAKIRQGAAMPDLPLPAVLGGDVSGVVEAVGAGVSDFEPGDEVVDNPEMTGAGSYADYNAVPAAIVAPKRRALSHVEAAAVPLAGGPRFTPRNRPGGGRGPRRGHGRRTTPARRSGREPVRRHRRRST